MKKITSITMHTTSEGQRLSYTYSVIDENTGAVVSSNNRESLIVMEIPVNKDVLSGIEKVKAFVEDKMSE